MQFRYEDRIDDETIAKQMANSFIRVIISMTTGLAVIALLFRMWLYTFWIEYKQTKKKVYYKMMEMQEKANESSK